MVGINRLWMKQNQKNPQKLNQTTKCKTHQNKTTKPPQNIKILLESIATWSQFKYFIFLNKY